MDDADQNNRFDDEVKSAVAKLEELCPGSSVAVQVMASWVTPTGTTRFSLHGSGNMFARIGMAGDFVDQDKATTLAAKISPESED